MGAPLWVQLIGGAPPWVQLIGAPPPWVQLIGGPPRGCECPILGAPVGPPRQWRDPSEAAGGPPEL